MNRRSMVRTGVIIVLLSAALALAFMAGCGSDSQDQETTPSSATTPSSGTTVPSSGTTPATAGKPKVILFTQPG